MDKTREEFEEWANAEGLPTLFLEKYGFYESHVTDIAWQAWQASRKAPRRYGMILWLSGMLMGFGVTALITMAINGDVWWFK